MTGPRAARDGSPRSPSSNRTGRVETIIRSSRLDPPTSGDTRTDDLEICWSDHISRTILEGSGRDHGGSDEHRHGPSVRWLAPGLKIVVDETVTEGGEGLVGGPERGAPSVHPDGVWTFVSGQLIRLQTAILRSGRRIFGVLGHAKELSSERAMKSVPFYRFLSDGATADITVPRRYPNHCLALWRRKKAPSVSMKTISIHASFTFFPLGTSSISSRNRVSGSWCGLCSSEMRLRFREEASLRLESPDSSWSLFLCGSATRSGPKVDVDPVKEGRSGCVLLLWRSTSDLQEEADSPIGADRFVAVRVFFDGLHCNRFICGRMTTAFRRPSTTR